MKLLGLVPYSELFLKFLYQVQDIYLRQSMASLCKEVFEFEKINVVLLHCTKTMLSEHTGNLKFLQLKKVTFCHVMSDNVKSNN